VCLLLTTCDSREILDPRQPNLDSFFAGVPPQPVPFATLKRLEGIYAIMSDASPMPLPPDFWGTDMVGKIAGRYFSFFGSSNRYFVLKAGVAADSSIVFHGYWRSAIGVDDARIGAAGFTLAAADGARHLLQGESVSAWRLAGQARGTPGGGALQLTFINRFPIDTNRTFIIVAHRAGRHDDIRTHSENSLKALRMIEQIGANAVEIDVRLTKDKVPILFHDAELTTREVIGDFAVGSVSNYTFTQLRALCTYRDGEPIPTLDEALDVVVQETTLEYLWLDIKEPELVDIVIPKLLALQRRLQAMPKRKLTVWFGLAYSDVNAAFVAHPQHRQIPAIVDNVENEDDEVDKTGAVAWSSRWTLGNARGEIAAGRFQQRGIKVLYWTLNLEDVLRAFIRERLCDGVVTDRPYLTSYLYHTNQRRPRP
jgi:glycerophosphoryl diester phosphodiesterase